MVFHLDPILCHYEVKSNLLTSLIAAIVQSKWFLEEEMSSMEALLQIDDERILSFGSINDQNFILESCSLKFSDDLLILEVDDQLMQILNNEFGETSIQISYCLQKVSQISDQALRRMYLIMQQSNGLQRDYLLQKFFMLEVIRLMTNLIECHIQIYFNQGNLSKMLDLDVELFKDVMKQLWGCIPTWRNAPLAINANFFGDGMIFPI